jgi:hypothetical protein
MDYMYFGRKQSNQLHFKSIIKLKGKMMRNIILSIISVLLISISASALSDQIYTIYTGSQNGVTVRDATTLEQITYFDPDFTPSSIVAGKCKNMYLTSGNSIYNYSNTGNLINSFTFPIGSINYHAIAYAGSEIYVAYDGSQNGVTVRDSNTFDQLFYFDPGFVIDGITAGKNDDMYLTSGNNIYNYSSNGEYLNSFTWPNIGILYSDITFVSSNSCSNKIYTVYGGSQEGVTVRDSDTLVQSNVVTPGFVSAGISSGNNNDIYLTNNNSIHHYSENGDELNEMVFPDPGITYTGITFSPATKCACNID